MSKINILPQSVYNRIAAGEVVERPASVVKELVENSIDAGATEISVYIENGGKQLIRVVDNGSGIERDDLLSAYMPHATSKIATAEDLENILTLGFRGEAIASISAVSSMTITSKVKDEKCYSLTCEGGKVGSITEVASEDVGTDVRVEGLFFNTPVRLKFLKTDKAEETEITTVVTRFILGQPYIRFTYYVNGKVALRSFGGDEEEAIAGVYKASVLEECFKIDATKHGIRIRGYIGNQNFYKPNKSYQSTFLNGRFITNATISAAMSGAYSSYLMKRQYPFYVLYLEMPQEVVDVNVHPNKSDVRFVNNGVVYGAIHSVVSAVLDGNSTALNYVINADEKEEEKETTTEKPKTISETILETDTPEEKNEEPKKDIFAEFSAFSGEFADHSQNADVLGFKMLSYEDAKKELEEAAPVIVVDKPKTTKNVDNHTKRPSYLSPGPRDPSEYPERMEDYLKRMRQQIENAARAKKGGILLEEKEEPKGHEQQIDYFSENKRYLEDLDQKTKQEHIEIGTCDYVGKLFNTYLLYQQEDRIYIIDQHAAHERLIFDRLKEQMQNRSVIRQPMLVPFEIELNAFEAGFIRERMQDIMEMGFEIEDDEDNWFRVTSIPADLQTIDLGRFFNDILSEVNGYRAIKLENILKDKLAAAACKAAVKGGMDLTRMEIDDLLKQMDGNMGMKCPHGRPIVVKMMRTQFEKMFKRIV